MVHAVRGEVTPNGVWFADGDAATINRQDLELKCGVIRQTAVPQLKSRVWSVDLRKEMPLDSGNFLENDMNAKLSIVLVTCVALFVSACGSSPQSLILGKWEVESAIKVTAVFSKDGTAKLTMFGQTLQGTYKLNAGNELEWTLNGKRTKSKVNVTATELEVTDDANRTIKYKRK